MAKIYRCMNVGDCPKGGQEIQVSDGDISPVCPECHQPLNCEEVTVPTSNGVPKLAIVSGIAVFILAAIGGGAYFLLNKAEDTVKEAGNVVKEVGNVANTGEKIIKNLTGKGEATDSKSSQTDTNTSKSESNTDSNNEEANKDSQNGGNTGIAEDDDDIKQQQQEGTDDLKKGKVDEAEIKNRKAMANQGIKLAVSNMLRKDYKKAEEALNKAKNLDADNPLIYYNLALISLERKDIKDALHLFEKCFDKATSNSYEAKYRNKIFEEIKSGSDLKSFRKTDDGKKLLELLEKYEKK